MPDGAVAPSTGRLLHDPDTAADRASVSGRAFWEAGWFWALLAAASLIPFLLPNILPFNDLSNHIGRHAVFLASTPPPFPSG